VLNICLLRYWERCYSLISKYGTSRDDIRDGIVTSYDILRSRSTVNFQNDLKLSDGIFIITSNSPVCDEETKFASYLNIYLRKVVPVLN
jgi:hypothetical protein